MSADDEPAALLGKLGGRTFLLTLGCGMATTVLTWFGKIDGGTFSVVTLGTVGAYIAANAVHGVAQIKGETQIATTATGQK